MIVELTNKELQYLYETPLNEIKGKQKYSLAIIKKFKARVELLCIIDKISDLLKFKSLNFERLHGNYNGYCSVRLNDQFRLIFRVVKRTESVVTIELVEVTEISKHYE